jgi:sugar/nucleoside kinase (ribokinase family)
MISPPKFDCLVAGDANVDLLVDGVIELQPGTEKLASGLDLVLGGSSAITAFNLSSLGATVTFAGVIGADLFGRFVQDKLAGGGVDQRGLRRVPHLKSGVTIWHSCAGKRAGVTYAGTSAMLELKDVPDELLKSARHFHMGAYFLQTNIHADAPALFARARKLGLTTSVDCNYDPAERWDSNLREVLKHADLFFPNEDEARHITGESTALAAARSLASLAKTVVVKRGAGGALLVSGSTEFDVPAVPAIAIDTTGAGDSFNAGFLAAFLQGGDLKDSANAGARAGARNVQYIGGTAAFENHECRHRRS